MPNNSPDVFADRKKPTAAAIFSIESLILFASRRSAWSLNAR
jgi:hypothetical protein